MVKDNLSFINKAHSIHGKKYDYSKVEYKSTYDKVEIICPKHGSFYQSPKVHFRGSGCNKCGDLQGHKKLQYTTSDFINKAKKKFGNLYDYTQTVYSGINSPVKIICKQHGEFERIPSEFFKGHICPKCKNENSNKIKNERSEKTFIDKANLIHNNFYSYENIKYTNYKTKVNIVCNIHGEFKQLPGEHLRGKGCPKCSQSKGEKNIETFLIKNNIHFNREFYFAGCISKKSGKLRYDFYLPNYNTCIEFDGPQHFKVSNYFGKEAFKNTKENDEKKNKYCSDNGIGLIRIKYTDKDKIPKILKEHLK